MTPDELPQRYPRETLRWLRRRLGLSQEGFAERTETEREAIASWETPLHGIGPGNPPGRAARAAPGDAGGRGLRAVARAWRGTQSDALVAPWR